MRARGGLGKACAVNKLYRGLRVSTGGSVAGNAGEDYGKRDKSKLQDLGLERKTDRHSQQSFYVTSGKSKNGIKHCSDF